MGIASIEGAPSRVLWITLRAMASSTSSQRSPLRLDHEAYPHLPHHSSGATSKQNVNLYI